MTDKRKRDIPAMATAIRSLLYIQHDDTVAIHCAAKGFTVTPADVAKVRRSQPRSWRGRQYLSGHHAATDAGMGEINDRRINAADASARLLARIAAAHPERVG